MSWDDTKIPDDDFLSADWNSMVIDQKERNKATSGTTTPIGNVTPEALGNLYINTTDTTAYIATGLTSADWELIDVSSIDWGVIGGTLSNQTDLQNALDLKQNIADIDTAIDANANVIANTTHRSSDGTDHSNVVLNDAHRIIVSGNPHVVTKADVGLGNVPDIDTTNDYRASNFIAGTDYQAPLGFTPENVANKNANNGYCPLDAGGKVPSSNLPSSVMDFKGTWNATTNIPALADGTGDAGDIYLCDVAGTQDLGSGSITFAIGDWVVYNGTIWQKSLNSNAVVSVNTQTGVVTLTQDDILNGSTYVQTENNFTDAQVNKLAFISVTQAVDLDTMETDIGLNNTHRTSSGVDHSDVVLNNTHRGTTTGNPHQVLATEITDFDTEVSNNTDVTSNSAFRTTPSSVITAGTNLTWDGNTLNATGDSSPLTTKGDLYTYDTADTRLPIGTDGFVLTADSAEATGLKWASVSGTGVSATLERTYTGNLATGRLMPITIPDELNAKDIKEIRISVLGLPTGQNIKVDVRKNGTTSADSIFTSDAEIEISTAEITTNGVYQSGCNISGATIGTPNTTIDSALDTLASDDVLWVYITQVGSTLTGSDLLVQISVA